nr:MAG TPA: hypothetical protein [Caudoviricetes sp.]
MACGGCGSVRGMTKPEVSNYIQELIDQHKLQAGINDCDGKALPAGAEVVLCDKLADIICDLIKTEKVCFPTVENLAYDAMTETLTLTFGGQDYTTHIKVKGSDVTGEGKNGVYTIYQDGKEVVKIDTGVQDVKVEDGKLKVSKSGGVEKEFDLPMPTVTPTELTDNGNGTGSVKYGDKTLPVMTKPTTATKAEDGVVTITNSNGTEVTLTIPDCPDTLLVDAFDKVEVGYIHSATCDKSALEKEPEPAEKPRLEVGVRRVYNEDGEIKNASPNASDIGKQSYLLFEVDPKLSGVTSMDAPVNVRLTSKGMTRDGQVLEDVYTATIPAGSLTATVTDYKLHPDSEFEAVTSGISAWVENKLEVLSYTGKYVVEPTYLPTVNRQLDHL